MIAKLRYALFSDPRHIRWPWVNGHKKQVSERGAGWSFLTICHTVGLAPSAQSSLNPETLEARYDGRIAVRGFRETIWREREC